MLLVLAMIVMMAGLAWPALRSSMAKSRLRDSAQQLRVELARARLTAMESGVPLEFRYRAGEGRFRIAAQAYDDSADPIGTRSARGATGGRLSSTAARQGEADSSLERQITEATLPDGVVFATQQADPDAAERPTDKTVDATFEDDSLLSAGWSPAIVFLPDGTAANATLALRNGEGSQVTVQLRGVTGMAKPGDVESCDEKEASVDAPHEQFKTAREDNAPLVR
jgi:Tfp pilus assembly protein FimT